MVQLKCPVCGQEHIESKVEFCLNCSYLLTTYSPNLLEYPEIQQRENKRLLLAREAWNKYSNLQKQLETANEEESLLKQQLQAASEDNQPSLNNSSVEQYLSKISSNIQYLPNMLTILQQIHENLVSQSLGNGLVSAYNINPHSLSEQAITVYETEYSFKQRLLGKKIQPILESDSRGNYWIITEGNDEYLVPKANIKINEHNYLATISTFFNCLGYNSNSSNTFTLVKPAKVYKIGEQWELIKIGELQF
ncbi:hypothetical protein [Dolichospermum sp. UHCC 0259]|uniref:hypothetical protein n=1 Tax=Dolichospermum sp. UHCC 0259 TaxID=2590010 RepID=UPI0014452E6C|nr:hypothetical protein [Dolichospermum sp. UHCC 0259]MTJ49509.1 hypothetical protein [Dolichospermum sp. UHCC 0259]